MKWWSERHEVAFLCAFFFFWIIVEPALFERAPLSFRPSRGEVLFLSSTCVSGCVLRFRVCFGASQQRGTPWPWAHKNDGDTMPAFENPHFVSPILVRQGAERKVPEFFKILTQNLLRKMLRTFPVFFEDSSCHVSWEAGITKKSPKIHAISQCQIPRQNHRKQLQKFSGERAK